MNLSIVICTRNRSESLNPTLQSLQQIALPSNTSVDLVVVDNGSTDSTRQIVTDTKLRAIELRYLFEPQAGLARARHAGIAGAQGEIIVFLDDDTRPDTHWLERITEPIRNDSADCVTGGIRIAPHLLRSWMTQKHRGYLASTEGREDSMTQEMIGANMAFHRRVLEKVPAFDTELGAGALGFYEDTLFSHQLLQAGYRLRFAPLAVMEHHFDPSRLSHASFIARARGQGCSRAYVDYHWHHLESQFEYFRAAEHGLRLVARRIRRKASWPHPEGAPDWELNATEYYYYHLQLARLAGTRRKYLKRGLKKLI